jgi:PKD repeat protein
VTRRRTLIRTIAVVAAAGLAWTTLEISATSLPLTSSPTLKLTRTIRTSPFENDPSDSLDDGEGSAYVSRDDSLWLVDDNNEEIVEVDPSTGAVKRVIPHGDFEAAQRYGGSSLAGPDRDGDLESMAYDQDKDLLYAFSGSCCTNAELPTVFRLKRDQRGVFQVDSYQPLSNSADYTGAAWNPTDGELYVGVGPDIRRYDYPSNDAGSAFQIPHLGGIRGMTFSPDGADLFTVSNTTLYRADWATKTLVPGWTLDLSPFDIQEARGVELIGSHFFVVDGYDSREMGDPLRYAVFVLNADGQGTPADASFKASTTSGHAPLSVSFTDTSSHAPVEWWWDFGDGSTSSAPNPDHTFKEGGVFGVRLTVSNEGGSSSVVHEIAVSSMPSSGNLVGNAGFENSTKGWSTSDPAVTLSRVSGGHSGAWAAHVKNTAGTRTCKLTDHPSWVGTTHPGVYTAKLWVRSKDPGAVVKLRVTEYVNKVNVGYRTDEVKLKTSWRRLVVAYQAGSPGVSSLDLQTYRSNAPNGLCFEADDASITLS